MKREDIVRLMEILEQMKKLADLLETQNRTKNTRNTMTLKGEIIKLQQEVNKILVS